MNKTEASSLQLEILISTVDRNSLEFLNVMFQYNNLSDYQILVINQTSKGCTVSSNDPKIRVINSYDKGLSKSRNLALVNAVGDICLLADDDVIYLENFEKSIIESYTTLNNADLITFKTLTPDNKPYGNYPKSISRLGAFSNKALSIEITFKRISILNSNILFNEHFGLGATFQDSENYIFLKDLMRHKNLELFFVPKFIVVHEPFSSSDEIASDRWIFARSALNYKLYGNLSYIYVLKIVFYLLRNRLIQVKDIKNKLRIGHTAIITFKNLKKT